MEFLGFGPPNQLSSYEMKKFLDQGGFGTVCSFKHRDTDQEVAIKIIHIMDDTRAEEGEKMVQREMSLQCDTLRHANIVKYDECWEQDFSSMPSQIQRVVREATRGSGIKKIFCFKMNLYDCSLKDWLKKRNADFFANGSNQNATIPIRNEGRKGYTSEYLNKVLKYFKQILDAVEYYQSQDPSVMHRDLKPANILYDKSSDSFLISDFGLGREYFTSRSLTRIPGTFLYAAPEQQKGSRYTKCADYHPLGIILYEMLFPLQEEDFLGEKLEYLKREDTANACEAMYHSLPRLCSLITKMVGPADLRPELTEIFQVIHLEIIVSFLSTINDWEERAESSLNVIDKSGKTMMSSFCYIDALIERIESSLCEPEEIMENSLRDIRESGEMIENSVCNGRESGGTIKSRSRSLDALVKIMETSLLDFDASAIIIMESRLRYSDALVEIIENRLREFIKQNRLSFETFMNRMEES